MHDCCFRFAVVAADPQQHRVISSFYWTHSARGGGSTIQVYKRDGLSPLDPSRYARRVTPPTTQAPASWISPRSGVFPQILESPSSGVSPPSAPQGGVGGSIAGGSVAGGSVAGGSIRIGRRWICSRRIGRRWICSRRIIRWRIDPDRSGSVAGGSVAGGSVAGGSVAGGSVAGGSVAGGSVAYRQTTLQKPISPPSAPILTTFAVYSMSVALGLPLLPPIHSSTGKF